MPYPESMVQLIQEFAKMPGVGVRTAERFAFYALGAPPEDIESFVTFLVKVNSDIQCCQNCFNLSEGPVCHICSNVTRDQSLVCVVQDPKDIIAIEKGGEYRGVYHVLLGVLSPLEGIGPQDIKVKELLDRVKKGAIQEVIIATSSDTEGDATFLHLSKQLKPLKVKVTRIAHGVPVGSALEFVDKTTLARALRHRQEI